MESYVTETDTKGHGMANPPIYDQQFYTFNVVPHTQTHANNQFMFRQKILPHIMWWRGDSGARPTTQSAQPFINEHSTHQS
jgi:hypothetical protein